MFSEKHSIRFHAFARLVPPLKMTLSPLVSSDSPKGFANVIIFLDDRRTELTLAKVIGGSQDRLPEIGMLKQAQG